MKSYYDAVVIGSGPNGLAAAITLAKHGLSVLVTEGADTIGGGTRTELLTREGFWHDVCSAVHPLGIGSPFFQSLPLPEYGLRWVHPEIPLAHALDPGQSVFLYRSLERTAAELDQDKDRFQILVEPWVRNWDLLSSQVLGPPLRLRLNTLTNLPILATALRSARSIGRGFRTLKAQALFGGLSAHGFRPLTSTGTAGLGLVLLTLAHRFGWPFAVNGSQSITKAMAAYFTSLGGEIVTGQWVRSLYQLPAARVILADTGPAALAEMAGIRMGGRGRRRFRQYRYGPSAFKLDYALSGPVPWLDPKLARAGTIHLGGRFAEMHHSQTQIARGEDPTFPFVLVAQPSLFDTNRAPKGCHTLWVYAHVPAGSDRDYSTTVEDLIECHAPGFREVVLKRCVIKASDWEKINPNLVGGDISGGANSWSQLLFRPTPWYLPYRTPLPGVFLCSASTPPGGGVHGMGGYNAAHAALRYLGVNVEDS